MSVKLKRLLAGCFLALILVSTACNPDDSQEQSATLPAEIPHSSSTPTPIPATPTVKATITPLPTRITPTIYPPMEPEEDWLTLSNTALQINLRYPKSWQKISGGEVRGEDGFAKVDSLPTNGMSYEAFCQVMINQGIPDLYGQYPRIENAYTNNMVGCVIYPAADAQDPQTVTAYLWPSEIGQKVLVVQSNTDFILPIVHGLSSSKGQRVIRYGDYLPAECRLNGSQTEVMNINGLRFERYLLTSEACYRNTNVEAFAALTPPDARKKAAELRTLTPATVDKINQALEPFQYQFVDRVLYQREDRVLPGAVDWIGIPLVNDSGTEFLLPAGAYLVSNDGVSEKSIINESTLGYVPTHAFLGDDLITVEYDQEHLTAVGTPIHLLVKREGEIIFQYTTLPFFPAAGPVRGLWTDQGQWYLELADLLIRDGEVLNETLGYQAMFTFQMIDNQPFYFFQQGENIFISYAGEILPIRYQEVIHRPACCSGAMVNMTLGYDSLGFYALQDGYWYYTIISELP